MNNRFKDIKYVLDYYNITAYRVVFTKSENTITVTKSDNTIMVKGFVCITNPKGRNGITVEPLLNRLYTACTITNL